MVARFNGHDGVADGQWYRLHHQRVPAPATGRLGHPGHRLQHVGAVSSSGQPLERVLGRLPLPGGLPRQRPRRLDRCTTSSRRQQRWRSAHRGAIFGLFGAWFVHGQADAGWTPSDRRPDRAEPGDRLLRPEHRAGRPTSAGSSPAAALTAAYAYAPRQNRTVIQVAATVAIVALLIAGVVVRDYQLVGAVRL